MGKAEQASQGAGVPKESRDRQLEGDGKESEEL